MSTASQVPHVECGLKGRRVNVVLEYMEPGVLDVTVIGWVWIGSEAFLRVGDKEGRRKSIKASSILMIDELDLREDEEENRG